MKNLGATCYLNSILQALYFTPELRRLVYEATQTGPVLEELRRLFARLQLRVAPSVQSLTRALGWSESEQQDAQEFLGLLFSKIETENPEIYQQLTKLFNVETTDYVRCLQCGSLSERFASLLDLPLSVPDHDSVPAAIETFLKVERLEGVDQYFCETCNCKQDAERGTRLRRLPDNLLVFLKRFAWEATADGVRRRKLNDRIAFPLTLDMNRFFFRTPSTDTTDTTTEVQFSGSTLGSPLRRKDSQLSPAVDLSDFSAERRRQERYLDAGDQVFRLGAVLVHSGTTEGGHYYALVQESDKWWRLDDEEVSSVQNSSVIEKLWGGEGFGNAYILVYRKLFGEGVYPEVPGCVKSEIMEDERKKLVSTKPHIKVRRLVGERHVSENFQLVEVNSAKTVEDLLEACMKAFDIDPFGRSSRLRKFNPTTKTWSNMALQSAVMERSGTASMLVNFGLVKRPVDVYGGDERLRDTFLCDFAAKRVGQICEMVFETSESFGDLPKILTGHKLVFIKAFENDAVSDEAVPVWIPAKSPLPLQVVVSSLLRALDVKGEDPKDFRLFRFPDSTKTTWNLETGPLEISGPHAVISEGQTMVYSRVEDAERAHDVLAELENFVVVKFNKIPGISDDKALPSLTGEVRISPNTEIEELPQICGYAGERVDMRIFIGDYTRGLAPRPQVAGELLRGDRRLGDSVNPRRSSRRECSLAFWKLD